MLVPILVRQGIGGVIAFPTVPVDVSEAAALVLRVTVHALTGTTPAVDVTLQTSDNLADWGSVGTSVNRSTPGTSARAYTATADMYGGYVRLSISLAGTDPSTNVSIYLLTHASS